MNPIHSPLIVSAQRGLQTCQYASLSDENLEPAGDHGTKPSADPHGTQAILRAAKERFDVTMETLTSIVRSSTAWSLCQDARNAMERCLRPVFDAADAIEREFDARCKILASCIDEARARLNEELIELGRKYPALAPALNSTRETLALDRGNADTVAVIAIVVCAVGAIVVTVAGGPVALGAAAFGLGVLGGAYRISSAIDRHDALSAQADGDPVPGDAIPGGAIPGDGMACRLASDEAVKADAKEGGDIVMVASQQPEAVEHAPEAVPGTDSAVGDARG